MMDALRRALDARAVTGDPALFWLRDDDATEPDAALDRLLDLTASSVPLTLAVIPAFSGAALAERLADTPGASVAVHGWSHANHAGPGEKPQELGPHRPADAVLAQIARGAAHLTALHGRRALPMLVPPWNRIAPAVVQGLPALGFRALSVFGPEQPSPLRQINTQVDLIDWRGTRGGRPEPALTAELLARLQTGGPVGLLTHHKVHDAAAWRFLTRLLALTAAHPGCRWVAAADLMR